METVSKYFESVLSVDYVYVLKNAKSLLWHLFLLFFLFLLLCLVLGGLREIYTKQQGGGRTVSKRVNDAVDGQGRSAGPNGGTVSANKSSARSKWRKIPIALKLGGKRSVSVNELPSKVAAGAATSKKREFSLLPQASANSLMPNEGPATLTRGDLTLEPNKQVHDPEKVLDNVATPPPFSRLHGPGSPPMGKRNAGLAILRRQSSAGNSPGFNVSKGKGRRTKFLPSKSKGGKKLAHVATDKYDRFRSGLVTDTCEEDDGNIPSEAKLFQDGLGASIGGTNGHSLGGVMSPEKGSESSVDNSPDATFPEGFSQRSSNANDSIGDGSSSDSRKFSQYYGRGMALLFNICTVLLIFFIVCCALLSKGCMLNDLSAISEIQSPTKYDDAKSDQGDVKAGGGQGSFQEAFGQCANFVKEPLVERDWASISHSALFKQGLLNRAVLCRRALSVGPLSQGTRTMKAFSCVLHRVAKSANFHHRVPSLPLDSTLFNESFLGIVASNAALLAHAGASSLSVLAGCLDTSRDLAEHLSELLAAAAANAADAATELLAAGHGHHDPPQSDLNEEPGDRVGRAEPFSVDESLGNGVSAGHASTSFGSGLDPFVQSVCIVSLLVFTIWVLSGRALALLHRSPTSSGKSVDQNEGAFNEAGTSIAHCDADSSASMGHSELSPIRSDPLLGTVFDMEDGEPVRSDVQWSNLSKGVSMDLYVASSSVSSPLSVATPPPIPVGGRRSMRKFLSVGLPQASLQPPLTCRSHDSAPAAGSNDVSAFSAAASYFGGDTRHSETHISSNRRDGLFSIKRREAEQQRMQRTDDRCKQVLARVAKLLKVDSDDDRLAGTRRSLASLQASLRVKRCKAFENDLVD